MDYFKIIKKSIQFTFKYKFLILLGILAAFTEGGTSFPNFSNLNSNQTNQVINWFKNNSSSGTNTSSIIQNKILGNQITISSFTHWIQIHIGLIIILALVLFLISLFIFIISNMAKGGLIWGVSEINQDKKTNFKESFKKGYHAFWRIFGLEILVILIMIAAVLIYILPIVFLIVLKTYVIAVIWAAIILIPFILFAIFISILRMFSLRLIVLENLGIDDSFSMAYHIFKTKFKNVFFVWLFSVILGIVLGIAFVIAFIAVILILGGIVYALYLTAGVAGAIISGIILGIVFFIACWLASGILTSITSSYWTLSYLELTK
jgi:hypothetical protein